MPTFDHSKMHGKQNQCSQTPSFPRHETLSKHIMHVCGSSSFSGRDIFVFFDFLGNDLRPRSSAILVKFSRQLAAISLVTATGHSSTAQIFCTRNLFTRQLAKSTKNAILNQSNFAVFKAKTVAFAFENNCIL